LPEIEQPPNPETAAAPGISRDGDHGAIAESWYIAADGTLTLTDAAGRPLGKEWRAKLASGENELLVAKHLLRKKLKSGEPFSGEIQYPDIRTVVPY